MIKQTLTELIPHRLLSPEEAAAVLGVCVGTLAVWRSTGRYDLAFVKAGRRVMYHPDDLKRFIERRSVQPKSDAPSSLEERA